MKKNSSTLVIFFLLMAQVALGQQNLLMDTLELSLVGKKYEQLQLQFKGGKFDGQTKNGVDWLFSYPDSLREMEKTMRILIVGEDFQRRFMGFYGIRGRDTVFVGGFGVPRKFKRTVTFKESKKNSQFATDHFVMPDAPMELDAWLRWSGYGFKSTLSDSIYNTYINRFTKLAKEEPNQIYFMAWTGMLMHQFKTKKDLQKIYNLFNEEVRGSYWGRMINRYINNELFVNSMLFPVQSPKDLEKPTSGDAVTFVDPMDIKFQLIVFVTVDSKGKSILCEQLGQLYSKIKDKVTITQVALNSGYALEQWRECTITNKTPWRCLYDLREYYNIMRTNYNFKKTPHAILVNPKDMSMKIVDVTKLGEIETLIK